MIRLIMAGLCSLALFAPDASGAVLAKTGGGVVRGTEEDGLAVYRGVPFAAPPVGSLRWREPQPPPSWTDVRDAARFAPACPQMGVSMPGETPPVTSEDCLYVNLWAPTHASHLPVLVWIYGGGFTNGSAAMPLYWGDQLARRGIVVVTVGYRLGPLGFLALPELTKESSRGGSGNYALLDQIAALKWVQTNIAAFGGDPARVTIAGQSAGAASVSLLMASPRAKGLFRGAIGQSGGVFEPMQLAPQYLPANAERDGEAYAASLGAKSLAELRALPVAQLLKGLAGKVSHPVVGSDVLPLAPYDALASGRANIVPLLVGSNADEARAFVHDLDQVTAANFDEGIAKSFGPLPPQLLAAYPHATDEEARRARLDFERDLRFGWDVWAWTRLAAQQGAPVFSYRFTHVPPFPAASPYAGWGASHFAELWYMFDHLQQEPWPWTAADKRLASRMADYWANFVKTGNPNGASLPSWPRFRMDHERVFYLDDPARAGEPPGLGAYAAFDAVYGQLRGAPFGKPAAPN